MADRQPWFKFHTVDWRGDHGLHLCSFAARGLWIEMLAVMHEATPYGHFLVEGESVNQSVNPGVMASALGTTVDVLVPLLAELEKRRVFSRNLDGVIFSRRMVRDHEKAQKNAVNGRRGGNPALVGDRESVNPSVKPGVNPARGRARSGLSLSDLPEGESEREPLPRPRQGLAPPAPKNAAYAGRVCVPSQLDAEIERKSRWDYPTRQAWYREVEAAWADKPIGENDWDFWRARLAERFPPAPKVNGHAPRLEPKNPTIAELRAKDDADRAARHARAAS